MTRAEWKILILMLSINVCLMVDFMIIMPQGPQLMRLFDISAQKFSLLVTAYTLGAGVMGILASLFLDQYNKKNSLIFFIVGFSLANLFCGLANTYNLFLVSRFITGAFGGVVGSLLFAIISDTISLERRGYAFGVLLSGFAFASIIGVPIGLTLSNKLGWQSPFIALFFVAILLALTVKTSLLYQSQTNQRVGLSASIKQMKVLLSNKTGFSSIAFVFFLILGHFTINPFLFPSLVNNAGVSETQLPIVYIVVGICSVFASIYFGRLADKFGKKKVFLYSLLTSLISILLVTNLGPGSLFKNISIVALFFILMGGRTTPAFTLLSAAIEPERRGSYLSLIGSVQQLAAALAAFISGLIVVKTDQGQLLHFHYVGFLAVALSLVALFLSKYVLVVEGPNT